MNILTIKNPSDPMREISQLAKERGLSYQDLARMTGFNRQAVYRWLCGETLPSLEKFMTIAGVFGFSEIHIRIRRKVE